jgi:predicted secreted protein
MNGVAVALSKSCDIEVQCDTEEVASPTTADWRDFIAGRKDWTINVSVLLSSVSTLVSAVGSTVTLTFGLRNSVTDRVSGTAICTKCQIQGTVGNLASGSFEFTGSGALT